jgi:hypothetical protein
VTGSRMATVHLAHYVVLCLYDTQQLKQAQHHPTHHSLRQHHYSSKSGQQSSKKLVICVWRDETIVTFLGEGEGLHEVRAGGGGVGL